MSRRLSPLFLFALLLSFSFLSFSPARAASIFTVTNANDPFDGVCDADCGLREAINAANADPDYSIVNFNVPGAGIHKFSSHSDIKIMYPMTIDGTTQPGYNGSPLIELDGYPDYIGIYNWFFSYGTGIGGITIKGLAIINFGDGGINLTSSNDNIIEDNYLGVSADGSSAPGNGYSLTTNSDPWASGIAVLDKSNNNLIRGNVISGNNNFGIAIARDSNHNVVENNIIGLNPGGTAALGNQQYGIVIGGSNQNRIGGTTPDARNIISGNQIGVFLLGVPPGDLSSNVVQGNYIGTDITGAVGIGNSTAGIQLIGTPVNASSFGGPGQVQDDVIGGTTAGGGNVIAYNGVGISIGDSVLNTAVEGNSIFSNVGLGIDFASDGVTANDMGDGDSGPNNLQNYPILTIAEQSGSQWMVQGSLNSGPSQTYRVEFFANDTCDASGFGEGQTFLGAVNAVTNSAGNAGFAVAFPQNAHSRAIITATAADADHNTSEFSPCKTVVGASIPPPVRNYDTSGTPTLTWNPVIGATNYEIEVNGDKLFKLADVFHDDTIPADRLYATPVMPLGIGTYYWRVRAKDSQGKWGAWSATDSFVIGT